MEESTSESNTLSIFGTGNAKNMVYALRFQLSDNQVCTTVPQRLGF